MRTPRASRALDIASFRESHFFLSLVNDVQGDGRKLIIQHFNKIKKNINKLQRNGKKANNLYICMHNYDEKWLTTWYEIYLYVMNN